MSVSESLCLCVCVSLFLCVSVSLALSVSVYDGTVYLSLTILAAIAAPQCSVCADAGMLSFLLSKICSGKQAQAFH